MKPYHVDTFLSNPFSEDLAPVTSESEYDEVMRAMADDEQDYAGYSEWSADVENLFVDKTGAVKHKAQPESKGRIGGIEL